MGATVTYNDERLRGRTSIEAIEVKSNGSAKERKGARGTKTKVPKALARERIRWKKNKRRMIF
jgi:hypothetical protein